MHYLDSFLESVLPVIFASRSGLFGKYTLSGYVPRRVIDQLPDPTSAKEVIAKCRAVNAINETFEMVKESVTAAWNGVGPQAKAELISSMRQYGLEEQFPPHMRRLSANDEEALQIRWDIADMVYGQIRKNTLRDLNAHRIDLAGKDAPRLVAPDDQRILFDSLLELLRSRADTDFSVIAFTAPNARRQSLSQVRYRTRLEFEDFLDSVRSMMERAFSDWQQLQGFDGSGVGFHVQTILDPFIARFETLVANINGPIEDQKIYELIQKVLADPKNPNLTIIIAGSVEMSKYKITGGQQASVGDGARAENFVQQQTVGTQVEIPDLLALSQELSRLRSEAQKRANTPEELRATAELAEAEAAAKAGDKSKVIEKLKLTGKWMLGVAKDIGTSVAAKVIAHSLGLPG